MEKEAQNIQHEAERFWRYLLEKGKSYLKKSEIKDNYKNFRKLWNQKDSFDKVFDNLRKRGNIIFLFNKQWAVLKEIEFLKLKKNKLIKTSIFFEKLFAYLREGNVRAYFGFGSADYFRKKSWQTPHTFYIINEEHSLEKNIENQRILLVKFPKEMFIDSSILEGDSFEGAKFSDNEKTFLDKIYFGEYLNGKINLFTPDYLNLERIKMYLPFYKKYPLVKIKLISLLDEDQLKRLK